MSEDNKMKYVPDYSQQCDMCGQYPVVTLQEEGEVIRNFEMCGPCTFGSVEYIDPEDW